MTLICKFDKHPPMGWINTDRNGKVSEKSWQDTGEWRQVALRRFEPHKSCANTKTANCKPSRAFHREPWLLLNHKHTVNGNCEARASRFTFDRSSLISESRPSRDRMEQSRNKSKQNKKMFIEIWRETQAGPGLRDCEIFNLSGEYFSAGKWQERRWRRRELISE